MLLIYGLTTSGRNLFTLNSLLMTTQNVYYQRL